MNRIAIANLSTVTTLAKTEMAATAGGFRLPFPLPLPLPLPLPRPRICRIFPFLPICRRRPFPFPLPFPRPF